ncbi:MAG: hypothetical protein ACJ74T_20435 [Pyrinomonadaceae bacterium]
MRVLLLALILVSVPAASGTAGESFVLPRSPGKTVVEDLGRVKVGDTSRRLSDAERHGLCRMFVRAYARSVREERQDSFLMTGVPAYVLFSANFPEVKAKEWEGGSLINLGTIVNLINSIPEYRGDVVETLREGVSARWCART